MILSIKINRAKAGAAYPVRQVRRAPYYFSFSIDFQISGALLSNAMKCRNGLKPLKTSANSCVVQRIRILRPSIERLMV